MRQTYSTLHVHLVWATRDRLPLITAEREGDIQGWIGHECQWLKCFVHAIGGIEDHVHLLVGMPPSVSVSDLAKQVKGASAYLVNRKYGVGDVRFQWQGAYGAFSVSRGDIPAVAEYVFQQRNHHWAGTTLPHLEVPPEGKDSHLSQASRHILRAQAGR